jgi:hypothetical protein
VIENAGVDLGRFEGDFVAIETIRLSPGQQDLVPNKCVERPGVR